MARACSNDAIMCEKKCCCALKKLLLAGNNAFQVRVIGIKSSNDMLARAAVSHFLSAIRGTHSQQSADGLPLGSVTCCEARLAPRKQARWPIGLLASQRRVKLRLQQWHGSIGRGSVLVRGRLS